MKVYWREWHNSMKSHGRKTSFCPWAITVNVTIRLRVWGQWEYKIKLFSSVLSFDKFNNMDKFLKVYQLLKLTKDEIKDLNHSLLKNLNL